MAPPYFSLAIEVPRLRRGVPAYQSVREVPGASDEVCVAQSGRGIAVVLGLRGRWRLDGGAYTACGFPLGRVALFCGHYRLGAVPGGRDGGSTHQRQRSGRGG